MSNELLTEAEQDSLKSLRDKAQEFGVQVETSDVSNMTMDKITVPQAAAAAILKTIHLTEEAQHDAMDKLLNRTPNYHELSTEEATEKIKVMLTMETVVEFLRLGEYIPPSVDMIEVGIDGEGSIVVTSYDVKQDETTEKLFEGSISEEEVENLERAVNLFDTDLNIFEEAKKRVEKKGKVLPFQNREQRREAKKRGVSNV